MAAETWQMSDPWRIHPSHPVLDDDSAQVLEEAVRLLGVFRSPLNAGHAGLRLHVLASLINQAEALIPDAARDARHRDFSWSEIGQELGVTTKTARRRYGAHAKTGSVPLDPD
jgi:hypothetical protein